VPPEIDATWDVLLDPIVAATSFVVVRRKSWTDSNGIAQQGEQRVSPVYGSVTPTGDNSLVREDAYQSQNKTLMVITQFFLRAAAVDDNGVGWQPDLILWDGNYYLVKTVNDFSQFGIGFIQADCESFEYVTGPPQDNTPSEATGVLDFRARNNSGLIGVVT
jgi:galactose-6-phosphate isomerase